MKYLVFFKNSYCLTGHEYFSLKEGKILGSHSPHNADTFKTQKEAKEFASLFDLETEIGLVEDHIEIFKKCDYVYREFPALDDHVNVRYNPNQTKEEVIEWWKNYKLLPEKSVSFECYRTWPKLYTVTDYLWDLNSYYNRDYTELYHTCQIKSPKNGNFNDFKKEFELIKDFVTYEKDGYKIFPIFDHELSECETRHLYYKSDEDCEILGGYSGKVPLFKGDLQKCFNKIRDNFWYE